MKKPYRIIEALEEIKNGKEVYELDNARWLAGLRSSHPDYLTLEYPSDPKPGELYFYAKLMPQGLIYLNQLKERNQLEIS